MYIKPFDIWIRWKNWVALTHRSEIWYVKKIPSEANVCLLNERCWMDMCYKNSFLYIFIKIVLADGGKAVLIINNL